MGDVHETLQRGTEPEISRLAVSSHPSSAGGVRTAQRDAKLDDGASELVPREIRLMHRLAGNVLGYVAENKSDARVPAEFLAALTANESGGDPQATRFEPGVYQHLKSVAQGRVASYGAISKSLLSKEIERQKENGLAAEAGPAESHMSAHPSAPPAVQAGSQSDSVTSGPS